MGILIKASCVICVIALYSPVHETPVETKGALAAATAIGRGLGSLDAASAARGIAIASDTAQTLKAMPAEVRGRVLESAASLVAGPAIHGKRAQP